MNELLFLRKTMCYNIIQFHALTGCDTTSFLYGVGKIKLFQKITKSIISNLEHIVSANDDVIKNCEIFIQTELYNGTSKETYVEAKKKELNITSSRSSAMQTRYSSSELSVILLAALYRKNFPSTFTNV